MYLERRTSKDSSSRQIMRIVPIFILESETRNQTNYKYWPKFAQMDVSSSIKTANALRSKMDLQREKQRF